MQEKALQLQEFYDSREMVQRTPRRFDGILGKAGKGEWQAPKFFSINDMGDEEAKEAPLSIFN